MGKLLRHTRHFISGFCYLALCLSAFAQTDEPIGLIQGILFESKGSERSGEIKIKATDGAVFICRYDEKTYMEHTGMRVFASALHAEDAVEIVGDRSKFRGSCYARTIRIVDTPLPSQSRIRPYRMVTEHIAPRGDLTFSGVVIRLQNGLLLLRTRDGEASILIREDTRFIDGGSSTDRAYLKPNMRVFVRAGRNLEKQIEAYQISWGTIFKP